MDAVLRLLLAAGLLLAIVAAVALTRALVRRRAASHNGEDVTDLAGDLQLPGDRPAVLYFSGPNCTTCRTLQEPALETLTAQRTVQVVKFDASRDTAIARRFGVLTVPATVVLDAGHRVRAVNLGFADVRKLTVQLGY